MQKLAPRISAVGWSLWLLLGIGFTIAYGSQTGTAQSGFQTRFNFALWAAGIALSVRLCQRPRRKLALLLTGLCLYACWRFFLGEILFYMLPALGGLTFTDSITGWWGRS